MLSPAKPEIGTNLDRAEHARQLALDLVVARLRIDDRPIVHLADRDDHLPRDGDRDPRLEAVRVASITSTAASA
jgi:hypothetical protein